jgi:hypothetical protein
MTRHYTHTSEAAAGAAVDLLPVIIGDAPKALPAPDPLAAFKDKVRTWAEKLTAKTWKEARAELLALAE